MGVLNKISKKSAGVIPLSIDFIFKFLEEQKRLNLNGIVDWQVHLSFCQIYLEQIQDLLNPGKKNL